MRFFSLIAKSYWDLFIQLVRTYQIKALLYPEFPEWVLSISGEMNHVKAGRQSLGKNIISYCECCIVPATNVGPAEVGQAFGMRFIIKRDNLRRPTN